MKEGAFEGMANILNETADAQGMVRRFLANLIRSYQMQEDEKNSELLMRLFRDMDAFTNCKQVSELTPEDIINCAKPLYRPGEWVCHVRYGYRGIVVEVDQECKATDSWYYGNQTQPSRHQAWYHVLVNDSDQVTYAAEENLIKYASKEEIKHSLLFYFFTKDKDGKYVRNNNPWPETEF